MRLEWASPEATLRVGGRQRLFTEETNRAVLNHESFGETKGTSAWTKGTAQLSEWVAARSGEETEPGEILTDGSDSQIAEDPERVSTAQGG